MTVTVQGRENLGKAQRPTLIYKCEVDNGTGVQRAMVAHLNSRHGIGYTEIERMLEKARRDYRRQEQAGRTA